MRKRINIFTQNFDIVSFRAWEKDRNPGAGDDTLYGFGVNDEWTNRQSGEIFKCVANAAGQALWVSLTASALPQGTSVGQTLIWTGTGWALTSASILPSEFPFSASLQVVIEHNRGYIPSVTVVDPTGLEVICTKTHESVNKTIISFTEYQSGTVIVK